MKKYLVSIIAGLALIGWSNLYAHEGHPAKTTTATTTAITATGQIIDPVCFIGHGASGPEHRDCAQACAKMGINLAFYNDADHQIYMIFPTGHADPNAKVVDFAEKRVEITGTIHKKDGYQGIEVDAIKEIGEGKDLSTDVKTKT
jgi:hypothetical protein